MIDIFKIRYEEIYFFTTSKWFSSDFDSLEQLIGVGLDDPDKILFKHAKRVDSIYTDVVHLCKVNTFEEIETKYPELFI